MEKIRDFFSSYNVLKLKIIGLIGTVMLTLAWSGIIKSFPLIVLFGTLGASSITIFAFLMNEGYKQTHSVNLYMIRLIVLSVLSAFPYFMVYLDKADFNNFLSTPFMIFYCLGTVFICDRWKKKSFRVVTLILLCIISMVLRVEYAPFSILVAYFIHEYDGEKQRKFRNFNICLFMFAFCAACLCIILLTDQKGKGLIDQNATMIGCVLGLPFINRYNGKVTESESPKAAKLVKWSGYFGYLFVIIIFAVIKYFVK